MKNILLSTCALVAMVAPALAAEGWTTDFPAALQQAAKENKAVMADFNGSDWCGPCIKLKSKVLATPEFAEYAKDKLILVDVDMPRGDAITPEQKEINAALCKRFTIRAYPTILVFNKDGALLGGFIGGTDKIDKVKADIDAALANAPAIEAALAKAASLTGAEKVKALMEAYNLVPEGIRDQNAELKALIMENDPDDVSGLVAIEKEKAAKTADLKAMRTLIQSTSQEKRMEALQNELKRSDVSAYYLQLINEQIFNVKMFSCATAEDIAALKAEMLAYGEANPAAKSSMEARVKQMDNLGDEALIKQLNAVFAAQLKK